MSVLLKEDPSKHIRQVAPGHFRRHLNPQTIEKLNAENVYPKRYFYPSLHETPIFDDITLPIAESVARTILCLPLYDSLSEEDIAKICDVIRA